MNLMAITENDYKDKKEYWDYQRKVEFNKEKLKSELSKYSITNSGHEVDMSDKNLFDTIWSKLETDDYDEPLKGWIPINNDYRLWNEGEPRKLDYSFDPFEELEKPKGRKVILRAKEK